MFAGRRFLCSRRCWFSWIAWEWKTRRSILCLGEEGGKKFQSDQLIVFRSFNSCFSEIQFWFWSLFFSRFQLWNFCRNFILLIHSDSRGSVRSEIFEWQIGFRRIHAVVRCEGQRERFSVEGSTGPFARQECAAHRGWIRKDRWRIRRRWGDSEGQNWWISGRTRIVKISKDVLFQKKLKSTRDFRPRPHLDSKIVAAWQGMAISGLAKVWKMNQTLSCWAQMEYSGIKRLERCFTAAKGRRMCRVRGETFERLEWLFASGLCRWTRRDH